jgi:membrane protein DedA with SNARE-associated domain/rhodanese-related sulfurtransferase
MGSSPHAWWDWGYGGIFICVFLEQIGVPIPAFPALIAAGALVSSGELDLMGCLLTALGAALLADLIWYQIGRAQGGAVLNLMCRLSWRPDSCASKTKTAFVEHGTKTLLFSKFVPGLSILAPPLAGMSRVPVGRFVLYDGAGAIMWALVPLAAGSYLHKAFAWMEGTFSNWKSYLPWIAGALIVAVLIWRYWNRRNYQRKHAVGLAQAIDADALKARFAAGEELLLLDIRDELSVRAKPALLPHARWMPYTTLPERVGELALDKPIIVYCDCPHDEASVAMADWLRAHGAKEARPLRGGLEDWVKRGWPTGAWALPPNGTNPLRPLPIN